MYFMRHGQSEFNLGINKTGRDPNIPDAILTAEGQRQALQTASKLKGKNITHLCCSPYRRAIQTAEIVGNVLGLIPVIEPLASEMRAYSCDIGSPVPVLRTAWPHLDFSPVPEGEWWLPFPEPHTHLMQRVQAFFNKWQFEEAVDSTLVVSHYYFINAATGTIPANAEVVEHQF
jgi:broad specificity phosphatase PhoE